ncbi:MAG TPA: hypothetical protein VD886_15260 [Herpetosiphonaceae bacterium]|nr:hypothetical protein [Herpetosiphonaceae bacterium]
MSQQFPWYEVLWTLGGAAMGAVTAAHDPARPPPGVLVIAVSAGMMSSRLGAARPEIRPRINRGALAGLALGAVLAIALAGWPAPDLQAALLALSLGTWTGAFGAAASRRTWKRVLWCAAGGAAAGAALAWPLGVTLWQSALMFAVLGFWAALLIFRSGADAGAGQSPS